MLGAEADDLAASDARPGASEAQGLEVFNRLRVDDEFVRLSTRQI